MHDLRSTRLLARRGLLSRDERTQKAKERSLSGKRQQIMKAMEENRAVLIAVFSMVVFNSLFLSANGLFMLIAPAVWYDAVPGVTDTGFFNQHFIRDIGIIQLFLGVAFGIGMIRPERRIGLWIAATLWLCAHALFHFWEVAVGICSPSVIPRDFPAVTLPAIIGVALTLWAIGRARAGNTAFAHGRRDLSRQPRGGIS